MQRLRLGETIIEVHDDFYTHTIIPGVGSVPAIPQKDEAYRQRAVDLGYGHKIGLMSREHEVMHTLLCTKLLKLPASPTMLALAGGKGYYKHWAEEESAVLCLQRFCNILEIDVVKLAMEHE